MERKRSCGSFQPALDAVPFATILGGVPGSLLVPAQDVAQPIVVFPQGVIEGHDGAAGDAEDHFDILADQGFTHDLGAGAYVGPAGS